MLPNFLIVGAAKCGTTSLYYELGRHPDFFFPTLKEPKFFTTIGGVDNHKGPGDWSVDKFRIDCFADYQELFRNCSARFIGEASPEYFHFPDIAVPEILRCVGDIPIIIILRNPARRAFSAYSYLRRDGRESLSFSDALLQCDSRGRQQFDFIWQYFDGGLYSRRVDACLTAFTRVKVVFMEDLARDRRAVLNDICQFIGADEFDFGSEAATTFNPSGIPSNIFAKALLSRRSHSAVFAREVAKKIVPRKWLEALALKSLNKMILKNDVEQQLLCQYKPDILALSKILDRDLSSLWGVKLED